MIYLAAVEACVVLALLWVLIAGQPAATQANLQQIAAQSTEITYWQSRAYPTPTSARNCIPGTHC